MKRLLLLLLALVLIAFGGVKFQQWKANPNLLANGEFSDGLSGWIVEGESRLIQNGTNTFLALLPGARLYQRAPAKAGGNYRVSFSAAEQHPYEFRPWRVKSFIGMTSAPHIDFKFGPVKAGYTCYVDSVSIKRYANDVTLGNGSHAEYFYAVGGGLSGLTAKK